MGFENRHAQARPAIRSKPRIEEKRVAAMMPGIGLGAPQSECALPPEWYHTFGLFSTPMDTTAAMASNSLALPPS